MSGRGKTPTNTVPAPRTRRKLVPKIDSYTRNLRGNAFITRDMTRHFDFSTK